MRALLILTVVSTTIVGCSDQPPSSEPKQPPSSEPKQPPSSEPKQPPSSEPKQPPSSEPKQPPSSEPKMANDDPVTAFKGLLKNFESDFEAKADYVCGHLGEKMSRWRHTTFRLKEYKLDVVKSDSLMNPYEGKVYLAADLVNKSDLSTRKQPFLFVTLTFDWNGSEWKFNTSRTDRDGNDQLLESNTLDAIFGLMW